MARKHHKPEEIVGKLRQHEQENGRLRRAISELMLEKLILKEAASGNYGAPRVTTKALQGRRRAAVEHVTAE